MTSESKMNALVGHTVAAFILEKEMLICNVIYTILALSRGVLRAIMFNIGANNISTDTLEWSVASVRFRPSDTDFGGMIYLVHSVADLFPDFFFTFLE